MSTWCYVCKPVSLVKLMSCSFFFFYLLILERGRDIDLLFHLLMQSLVIYGICPDQGSNPPLWYIRQRSNQLSYPARAAFFVNYFMSPPISSNIVYSFLHHHPELPTLCFTEKIKVATQEFLRFFLKIFFFTFREGQGGRGGEKHQCVVASPTPPTRDLACNPGMCPEWESNP